MDWEILGGVTLCDQRWDKREQGTTGSPLERFLKARHLNGQILYGHLWPFMAGLPQAPNERVYIKHLNIAVVLDAPSSINKDLPDPIQCGAPSGRFITPSSP